MRVFQGMALAIAVVAATGHADAGLLTAAAEAQLEGWLGEGNLTFTNVFTKTGGETSVEWHAAVDGLGRTFTLIEILNGNGFVSQIIGGYNPQSWSTIGGPNLTFADADRTAFLFNLTSNEIQRQKTEASSQGDFDVGVYQTYNRVDFGPTFGGGHDVAIYPNLGAGGSYQYSYGNNYNDFDDPITIEPSKPANFLVGQIETYTIAAAPTDPTGPAVPEPGTLTLLSLGGVGMIGGWCRRWRKAAAAA